MKRKPTRNIPERKIIFHFLATLSPSSSFFGNNEFFSLFHVIFLSNWIVISPVAKHSLAMIFIMKSNELKKKREEAIMPSASASLAIVVYYFFIMYIQFTLSLGAFVQCNLFPWVLQTQIKCSKARGIRKKSKWNWRWCLSFCCRKYKLWFLF